MENAVNLSVSPFQLLLALAFQIWLVVFPIIVIRKLNYLTQLINSFVQNQPNESSDQTDSNVENS